MTVTSDREIVRKVVWRLLPFSMLLFAIASIDRTNIGFAALQMNAALGFSSTVFGFGAGVFFIGYALFEIPSNLILVRTGTRRWIARIMITWGIIVVATAWIRGEYSFYLLRFLLGAAEAGFVPGMIYYLNDWIPRANRASGFAVFLFGPVLANIVGGPLAGAIMSVNGDWSGLAGWQLLLVLEGIPAVLLGFVTLTMLTERPEAALWLSDAEKAGLARLMAGQETAQRGKRSRNFREALRNPSVWQLAAFVFFMQVANYGVVLWLPQIIRGFSQLTALQVGFLSSGPYVLAAIGMFAWGRHSDATGERKWHLALAILLGAAGLAASALAGGTVPAYGGLCLAAIGISSTFGVFWSLPGDYLRGAAAAGGLALINSVGLLGGFVGPSVVGFVRDRSSGFTTALLVLSCSAVAAALCAALLRPSAREPSMTAALSPAK